MNFAPAAVATAILASGVPSAPPVATTTTRYHLTAKSDNTVDLSGFGGPTQVTNVSLSAWISMTLTDSAGGKAVHVVVDSATGESNAPTFQASDAAAAKGATVHGWLDPAGRIKDLKASITTNLLVNSIQGAVNGMFPKLRGATKAGDRWVDTTDIANAAEGNKTTAKVVTTYSAAAPETIGGIPGVRVNATSTSMIGGTLENPQAGSMDVMGTGEGKGSFVVAGDGRFLGGTVNSTQDLLLKTAMAPMPIPVKVVQALTVTLAP